MLQRDDKGLKRVTWGYRRLQGDTRHDKGYKGLHGVTGGYKG